MICRNCGTEGFGNFCSNCGSPLNTEKYNVDDIGLDSDFIEKEEELQQKKERIESQRKNTTLIEAEDQNDHQIKNYTNGSASNKVNSSKRKVSNGIKKEESKNVFNEKNQKTVYRKSRRKRKKRKKFPKMPSPNLSKTPLMVKKSASRVLQGISASFMAFIFAILLKEFIEKRNVLGSISMMATEKNYALALFFSFMGTMLLFSSLSFFWILTKKRIGSEKRVRTLDTGRGLFSFLSIGLVVLAAPEFLLFFPTGHDSLNGLKLMFEILSDCGKILWSLAVLGTVACLVRKFMKV